MKGIPIQLAEAGVIVYLSITGTSFMFSSVWLITVCGEVSDEEPRIAPGILLIGVVQV